ncbi:low temperature requirement protein A [Rugosimonospora acidiphila]
MRRLLRSRPTLTQERHRATDFEIFFDLVFVFALTRIIAFMSSPLTFLALAQGLLLLFLLWYSWSPYVWLGNQARADRGVVRAGTAVAMAAIFVTALVIPHAFRRGGGVVDAPLALAISYLVVRALQLGLYYLVTADDRRQRTTLLRFCVPTAMTDAVLVLGALPGPILQTVLWGAAFLIDAVGGRIATNATGWLLRSPSHFAERHGLVLIIALGESLISVGAGAGTAATRGSVLVAALLGLSIAFCLWWLYFERVAPAAGQALGRAAGLRRGQLAADAYTLSHFGAVSGVIFIALGIEQALEHVARRGHPAGAPLSWPSTLALFGGAALYLAGRATLLRLTLRSLPPAQLVAIAVAAALVPAAQALPPLAALGLLTGFLVALCLFEWVGPGQPVPATSAGSNVALPGR